MKPMTNGEKFKTAEERNSAFTRFCRWQNEMTCKGCSLAHTPEKENHACRFAWLDLKYGEEEKPYSCPFCEGDCKVTGRLTHFVECRNCGYRSRGYFAELKAIVAHNRLCRLAKVNKKSEVR